MPLNDHDIEQVEHYLSGNLPAEAKHAFERRLTTDPELVAELETQRLLRQIIELRQEERLGTTLRDVYKNTPYDAASFLKIYFRRVTGISLVVLLTVLGIVYWNRSSQVEQEKSTIAEVSKNKNSVGQPLPDEVRLPLILKEKEIPENVFEKTEEQEIRNSTEKKIQEQSIDEKNKESHFVEEKQNQDPAFPLTEKEVFNCQKLHWPDVSSSPACKSETDGRIRISGINEISASLNDTNDYAFVRSFDELQAGMYTVYLKHASGCRTSRALRVEEKLCVASIEVSFAPDAGERWEIPVGNSGNEKITIRDVSGKPVYAAVVSSGDFWNGTDLNGNALPSAVYHVSIESSGTVIAIGTVTILR